MRKQNVVQLSESERPELESVVTKGKAGARLIRRGHTLLLSDEGKTDQDIAKLLHVDELTVRRTRKQWAERHTLTDKPRRDAGGGWMVNRKRCWSHWRAVKRLKDATNGQCSC